MRWFFAFIFMVGTILPTWADATEQPPTFTNLKDALAFLDHELDTEDWNGLCHALYPALQPNEPNRTGWQLLKKERGQNRLVDVFSDREFPASNNDLWIGSSINASDKMVGWSVIRFRKTDNVWHLYAVFERR